MTTTISIVNLGGAELALSNSVSPDLDPKDWTSLVSEAKVAGQAVSVMTFNRDDGIKDGHTWTFTTAFTLDGVQVRLEERVTGTLLGSTMSQCITAGEATTGFKDTNDPGSLAFKGASGAEYWIQWTLSGAGFKDIRYTVAQTRAAYRHVDPAMPQIRTIVVLMLENRSLDNVLGWLYRTGAPVVVYPPGSSPRFDGIPAGASNSHRDSAYSPKLGTEGYHTPCRVPAYDPNEPMPHVKVQLYANAYGVVPTDQPWAGAPPMTGFAADYYEVSIPAPGEIMGAYSEVELPVMYGLATSFAVSDRWFSSVPTQTDPNRAFSICGTSLGAEVNSDIDENTFQYVNTVFNVIADQGRTFGVYWQSEDPLGTGEPVCSWAPFTSYYFSRLTAAPGGTVATYKDFLAAAKAGTLPNLCFLEPYWGGGAGVPFDQDGWVGIQGNDYHPPAWIGPAEAALNALYEALVNSPQWPEMLFIVTFDEHGGSWDHVPPPAATPPDASVGPSGFTFDRLGVRVPTLLVSPYIQAGTVFRAPNSPASDFDHTSLIATLCKWAGVDPASAGLGARVAVAPTFEGVLSSEARTDRPSFTVPAGYAQQGGGAGAISPLEEMKPLSGASAKCTVDVRHFRAAMEGSGDLEALKGRLRGMFQRKA